MGILFNKDDIKWNKNNQVIETWQEFDSWDPLYSYDQVKVFERDALMAKVNEKY